MKPIQRVFAVLGALLLAASLVMAAVLNAPTHNEQVLHFDSTYGDKAVRLEASYWPAADAEYAVLICPGYSCDRQKWRPMADLIAQKGLSVMTFDYSGQGASQGVIGFDNAKTDAIPMEIDDAISELCRVSGLDRSNIILLGHSMGGRSILRLMADWNDPDAETTIQRQPVGHVILIAPEVNYAYNAQASLFAGTSDDAQEPWHSYSPANTRGVNVYLYGSTADDIVSGEDILSIARRLVSDETVVPHAPAGTELRHINTEEAKITVGISGGVLHSYEMYSPKFAAYVSSALDEIVPGAKPGDPGRMQLVYGAWFTGLLGLWFTLHALCSGKAVANDALPQLTDVRAFLRRKALMWLPGTGMALLVCCLCVCMPFGSPVMNIPYMCFIAGYGLVMLLAYRKGAFRGTVGKLPRPTLRIRGKRCQVLMCAAVCLALCAVVWYVLRATMYRLIPLNARLFWVLLAAVLMANGYYVSGCENDMMDAAHVSRRARLVYNLITYVPLFLLVAFYLVLKSYSGMIGQVQNMVLMYIFCIPMGDFVRRRTGNRMYGAVVSAFLFQTLMITSAALISMF